MKRHHDELGEEVEEIEDILLDIRTGLRHIIRLLTPPSNAVGLSFHNQGKEITLMSLTTSQHEPVTLTATDTAGNPATVTDIVWASTDETIGTVAPAADGLSADVSSVAAGNFDVTVSATASDGTVLNASLSVEVTLDPAVALTIVEGAPEPK